MSERKISEDKFLIFMAILIGITIGLWIGAITTPNKICEKHCLSINHDDGIYVESREKCLCLDHVREDE